MAQSREIRLSGALLLSAAAFYSFVLCGLFTAGVPISNSIVAGVDAAIVVAALGVVAMRDMRLLLAPLLVIALNAAALGLVSGGVDFKATRDVLIICAFLALGVAMGSVRALGAAVLLVSTGALIFGVFEALAPDLYAKSFNVLQFYIMRGAVDPLVATYSETSLFVSSMRGEGRALLPFLGPHRVSSIFLEPVSMGNFGAILVALALSLGKTHRRLAVVSALFGVLAIIAADARFAAIATALFALARFAPLAWSRLLLAVAPVGALATLLILASVYEPVADDLLSRLSASGRAVSNLSPAALVGGAPAGPEVVDSGYAYVLSAFGLPFCVLLWAAFVLLPTPGPMSARFKLLFGLYMCALLCVSGTSLFALKTAAFAWFMLGSLIAAESARVRVFAPQLRMVRPAPQEAP